MKETILNPPNTEKINEMHRSVLETNANYGKEMKQENMWICRMG